MKKEYLFIFTFALIVLAHAIDSISGPIALTVKNPYQFLNSPLMSQYPLTTFGIFSRTIGLFLLVWLVLSFISGFNFQKAISLFVIFILSNLYAIQQLATGMKITTVQWTISIAFASTLLLIPLIYYLITGIIHPFSDKKNYILNSQPKTDEPSVD
ncbi:hypothetical protein A2574_02550 [Candidatus Shapirobacteria bacterium RIFOXYD1_FULL_38_32]|uniref:Uncharacterized protein n=2 Tax=Candidatus Shapironibacteriota TaxID=1752721 RepID=A0A1F7SS13_9BACT|nr:MAG: hypothetical protein UT14_C0015G0004 [Candidatus Shapirobacteria bacterium GW2011_GWE1_38_92]OGL56092.1 MAG: hypothetical protein A2195_02700 [Candidatus Shapirobacteria bacterium RIFOXYA1_FULL_39_17]OGL56589.1 MAG: hypothetical protein A2367_02145 [Candidatus Shapirobacteria bacterium RIFOXYB1_FULL_38_38]OGL57058.1 MAG: hypothetical protein A2410_00305 [Candidatus Shapirobacteria bacterium RIFOXYC1_FULL_38_24]OGL58515.1 MAG: hypothetical protein A2574_02550 [Candidatus Shapirobacteria 